MQASSRARSRRVEAPARRTVRLPKDPLYPILLFLVIGLASALVAVTLSPIAGVVSMGADALNARLDQAGASFTRVPHFPERSTIYAADGSVLATLYLDENREIVRLKQVAPIARKAVLAIEDDGFYQHGALNVPSVFRALLANLIAGRITQGGSTITQQLVKNAVIQDTEQTFARKFQEAALAIRLEQKYSKDQILALYLNEVYFGNGAWGIGTAAETYFGKPASALNLPQAALLAGLIQAPGDYDPVKHPQAALRRRNEVLTRLGALGWVPQARVDAAIASTIRLAKTAGTTGQKVQPFFVHYIVQSILEDADGRFDAFGKTYEQRRHTLFQGGLRIYTTLDPDWQRYAQEAVDRSPNIDMDRGPDTSLVSVDARTGAIRAMLSGKDYRRDQLDLAWHGMRQVGSAFKPFTLVAAFEHGFPAGKVYPSKSPYCSPSWRSADHCVSNAEGPGNEGYIDLWRATEDSINVVFAQLALDVGPENIVSAAHQMGITTPLQAVPSITLGTEEVSTLDMASAYSTLANGGVHCQPYAISKVLLPEGKKLYQHHRQCKQAIDPDIAHLVTAMMQRVVCCGTGTAAQIGRPVAGKTGTGQDYTNVYFAGFTPQVATAVWVGFPQGNVPMSGYYGHSVFGGTLAAPIWHDFMVKALAGMPVASFPGPPPPQYGKVPRVVGLRSLEAQKKLADANFTPIIEKIDSSLPLNTVIAQTPRAGASLALGGGVKLQVSNGKGDLIEVPRVVGMDRDQAVKAVEETGLVVQIRFVDVEDPKQDGLVLAQTPVGGKQAATGSTVVLEVGRSKASPGPTPPPTPAPSG
ncbi:MAG TPA: transglycosylase domain-containing protein [Actinomycetota bacterium]|nr:transglycosylase domain-containing protein [Actinomycetota bacterium]